MKEDCPFPERDCEKCVFLWDGKCLLKSEKNEKSIDR